MSERITEAELASIEREHRNQSQLEPASDSSLLLIAEVRRLRRLIVDSIPEYEYGLHALGAEAQAIREERG